MNRFFVLASFALLVVFVVGCGRRHRTVYVHSSVEPPAPYIEVMPECPGPDYVWVDGYWYWDGSEYVWLRGHWGRAPARGYVWVRSGWVHRGGRYHFHPGCWERPTHRPHIHYHREYRAPVRGARYETRHAPKSGHRRRR